MKLTGLHVALEKKVMLLGTRITMIRQKIADASPEQQIAMLGRLNELERRHRHIQEQLQALDHEGPGFRQNVEAKLILLADDLVGAIDDLMLSADEHYQARLRASSQKS